MAVKKCMACGIHVLSNPDCPLPPGAACGLCTLRPYMPERIADSSTVVQAYALSEELNKWLLFDDTNIKFIGGWREVAASMKEGRHQPSLLFYERV